MKRGHDDSFPRIIEDSLIYSFKPKLLTLIYIFEFLFLTGIFGSFIGFSRTLGEIKAQYLQMASEKAVTTSIAFRSAMETVFIHFAIEIIIILSLGIIASLVLTGLIIRGSYEFFEKRKDKGLRAVLSEIPKISYFRAFIYLIFISFVYGVVSDILNYLHVPLEITIIILVCILTPLFVFALPEIYVKERKFGEGISQSVKIFKEKYYYLIPAFAVEYIISFLITLLFLIPFFITLYKFGALHIFRSILAMEYSSGIKTSNQLIMVGMISAFKTIFTKAKPYLIISYLSFLMGAAITMIFKNAFVSRVYGVMERKLKL